MGFYPLYNHCVMLKPTRRQRFRIWLASKLFGLARRVSKGIEPRFLANAQEAFLVADRERNERLLAAAETRRPRHDIAGEPADPLVDLRRPK